MSIPSIILAAMLVIAAYYDVKCRAIPRWQWIPAVITVPYGVYRWAGDVEISMQLATLNLALVIGLLAGALLFAHYKYLRVGDLVCLVLVFTSLMYGFYPIFLLIYISAWALGISGCVLFLGKGINYPIPVVAVIMLGVLTALVRVT